MVDLKRKFSFCRGRMRSGKARWSRAESSTSRSLTRSNSEKSCSNTISLGRSAKGLWDEYHE